MEFHNILKKLREEHELLQKDLAKKLNLSNAVYNNYELGKRMPNYETLKHIAEYFNVSTDYLLGKTDDPEEKIIETKDFPEKWRVLLGQLGVENFGIFKNLSLADMTEEDFADILEAAIKIKNRHS